MAEMALIKEVKKSHIKHNKFWRSSYKCIPTWTVLNDRNVMTMMRIFFIDMQKDLIFMGEIGRFNLKDINTMGCITPYLQEEANYAMENQFKTKNWYIRNRENVNIEIVKKLSGNNDLISQSVVWLLPKNLEIVRNCINQIVDFCNGLNVENQKGVKKDVDYISRVCIHLAKLTLEDDIDVIHEILQKIENEIVVKKLSPKITKEYKDNLIYIKDVKISDPIAKAYFKNGMEG